MTDRTAGAAADAAPTGAAAVDGPKPAGPAARKARARASATRAAAKRSHAAARKAPGGRSSLEDIAVSSADDADDADDAGSVSGDDTGEHTEPEQSPDALYNLLSVPRLATTEEIRKAYRRQALKCHPDKLPADSSDAEIEAAKDAFQELSRAYAVLSDPLRRKRYDATGSVNESILDMKDDGVTWDDYFRELWSGVVNEASIGEFKVKYQYSEEERRDVLAAYLRTKGCLLSIIDVVPLSTIDDIERFKVIIQSAIDSGEVEHFKRFPQVSPRELARRRSQLKREAKEVEAAQAAGASGDSSSKKSRGKRQESSGSGSEASLAALIKARNAERLDDVIDKITQKYAPKPRGRPRKRPEPSAPAPQAAGESSSKKRRLRDAPLRPDQAGRSRSEHVEDVSQSDPRTGAVQDPARDTAANHGVADDNTHSPMFSAPIVLANPDGASSASNIQHSDVEVDAENHAEESDEPITELRIKKSGKAINPPTRESLNANDDRRGRRSRK